MSCLSQYLGDTPGIQVFLCSESSACASLCPNILQKCHRGQHLGLKPQLWREGRSES